MRVNECCYWRFKGEKQYRFGFPTWAKGMQLVRMGLWNGDWSHGPIVDPFDIEVQ